MKLLDFRMMTDANIHTDVVTYLRSKGCDVISVRDVGLSAASDRQILERAVNDDRIVITHDRDFGTLAMLSGQAVIGVVYLRPGHIDPQFTIGTLRVLGKNDLDLRAPFILVARRRNGFVRVRIRNL